jgi:antitoxin (DNA-binding transcriptional repressor) of toxin-antitoxin stability system
MGKEIKKEKVAFTVFRNELAKYLEKLAKGEEIMVMNARRGRVIVTIKRAENRSA